MDLRPESEIATELRELREKYATAEAERQRLSSENAELRAQLMGARTIAAELAEMLGEGS